MGDHIRYEVAGGIGTITIDRPEKRNAMTFAMLGDFIDTVRRAGHDDDCRVLILTGVPGAFCAGTDLADLASVPGMDRGLRGAAHEDDKWWPLVACGKPTIGAIDGPAVGMGAELSSQCDLRLCTPNARFAWNFAGTWLLPRLIGQQQALRLIYTGAFVDAEEAKALGFVLDVVEPADLIAQARALAEQILVGSPLSHRLMKDLVYRGLGRDVGAHMVDHTAAMTTCFRSDDHREGVASFLERRPAQFTGR